jgi:APA family basic amino acid/polyamine antiporter
LPRAGGQYVYLREAFSPLWGFLYGWTLFMVIQTDDRGGVVRVRALFGALVRGSRRQLSDSADPRVSGLALSLSTTQLVGS